MAEQTTGIQRSRAAQVMARFFKAMPVFFPLIALFHLGQTIFETFNYIGDESVAKAYWLRPLVLLLYSVFWIATCFRQRWGGIAYIALTICNVVFYLFGPDILLKRAIGDILFVPIPVNLLFSFLLLFFFRKME